MAQLWSVPAATRVKRSPWGNPTADAVLPSLVVAMAPSGETEPSSAALPGPVWHVGVKPMHTSTRWPSFKVTEPVPLATVAICESRPSTERVTDPSRLRGTWNPSEVGMVMGATAATRLFSLFIPMARTTMSAGKRFFAPSTLTTTSD